MRLSLYIWTAVIAFSVVEASEIRLNDQLNPLMARNGEEKATSIKKRSNSLWATKVQVKRNNPDPAICKGYNCDQIHP